MIKRFIDITFSLVGLLLMSPILSVTMFLIWLQDFHSPFYIATRVGLKTKPFKMIKLRSMIYNADKSGIDSTSADDMRVTAVGRFIRQFKLDEFSQLINVFCGQMSLVGPRPNVPRDVALYTEIERNLLSIKPGITDISSIVFSDEGAILSGYSDPDLRYNQIIRPWKSRLGLLYVEKHSMFMDMYIVFLTVIAIFSKATALKGVVGILRKWQASEELIFVAQRTQPLKPYPPPGMDTVVQARA